MTLAEWGLVVAVVSLLVGAGALLYARRAARISEEELELAREQATLRPKLVVSFKEVGFHHRPEDPGSPLVQAFIVFSVTNAGGSVAHHVRCEVRLDEQHLALSKIHGTNPDFFEERLGPEETKPHELNVAVRSPGPTEASYTCWCDEVWKSEGTVKFEVPEREQDN